MQKVKTAPKTGKRFARARTLPMLYVVFWSFAGAASAAYLGLVITDPELVDGLSVPVSPALESDPASETVVSPQARALRERLAEAQKGITQLRSELSERKMDASSAADDIESEPAPEAVTTATPTQPQSTTTETAAETDEHAAGEQQIASAEYEKPPAPEATAPPAVPGIIVPGVSIAPPPVAAPVVATATPDTPALSSVSEVAIANATLVNGPTEPSNIETGALAVPPAPAPGLRPKPKPAPVVTAAANPKPPAPRVAASRSNQAPVQTVAFGPPEVTPEAAQPAPAIGVRLSSGPSLDALRLAWRAMRERHGDALRGLKPRYVKQNPAAGGAGPYTLIAGPVAKPTDVLEICAGLGGESLECALTAYEGRTL